MNALEYIRSEIDKILEARKDQMLHALPEREYLQVVGEIKGYLRAIDIIKDVSKNIEEN